MKFVSWNVNGLRACLNKGFIDFFNQEQADFFCIQETKMQRGQAELDLPGYEEYFNDAIKKGYSGTAIFTKLKPLNVYYGLDMDCHDQEGRVITLEYDQFFLVNVYTPNSQRELTRLDYRMVWEDDFRAYLLKLKKQKAVIICGDLNVAHQEIDLKNPKTNRQNAGFTDQERAKMTILLNAGFIDSYRYIYPKQTDAYTWWSYMRQSRDRNIGWRIDYFLVSDDIKDAIKEVKIYQQQMGSDHCPIGLTLNMEEIK